MRSGEAGSSRECTAGREVRAGDQRPLRARSLGSGRFLYCFAGCCCCCCASLAISSKNASLAN
jgi:hypothetical protein